MVKLRDIGPGTLIVTNGCHWAPDGLTLEVKTDVLSVDGWYVLVPGQGRVYLKDQLSWDDDHLSGVELLPVGELVSGC
jgi:hypothetical protein